MSCFIYRFYAVRKVRICSFPYSRVGSLRLQPGVLLVSPMMVLWLIHRISCCAREGFLLHETEDGLFQPEVAGLLLISNDQLDCYCVIGRKQCAGKFDGVCCQAYHHLSDT